MDNLNGFRRLNEMILGYRMLFFHLEITVSRFLPAFDTFLSMQFAGKLLNFPLQLLSVGKFMRDLCFVAVFFRYTNLL